MDSMISMIAPINVHSSYKLQIVFKTWQQKHSGKHLFFKKIKFLASHDIGSTREDLSIAVSITNVGLILTKPRWFQLFSTSQNSISNFFEKNFKFLDFYAVVLVQTFPLMYQLLL